MANYHLQMLFFVCFGTLFATAKQSPICIDCCQFEALSPFLFEHIIFYINSIYINMILEFILIDGKSNEITRNSKKKIPLIINIKMKVSVNLLVEFCFLEDEMLFHTSIILLSHVVNKWQCFASFIHFDVNFHLVMLLSLVRKEAFV